MTNASNSQNGNLISIPSISAKREFNLINLLNLLRANYLIFLSCMLVGAFIASFIVLTKKPVYESSALIQVTSSDSGTKMLGDAGLFSGSPISTVSDIQTVLLRSRYTLEPLVSKLGLNVNVEYKYLPLIGRIIARDHKGSGVANAKFGLNKYAWGGEQVKVRDFVVPVKLQSEKFYIVSGVDGKYKMYTSDHALVLTGVVGIDEHSSTFPGLSIMVKKILARPGFIFYVSRKNMVSAVNSLRSIISISQEGTLGGSASKTGILNVSMHWGNSSELQEMLNEFLSIAVSNSIAQKSMEAAQSLKFIYNQLPKIKSQLNTAETNLNQYKVSHGVFSIGKESNLILSDINKDQTAISNLQLQKTNLLNYYTRNHPVIIGINSKISQLKSSLSAAESKMRNIPGIDQATLTLMKNVKIKEALYASMLSQIEKLQMAKAGTIGDLHILNLATEPEKIAEHGLLKVILGSIIGFFAALIFVSVRRILYGSSFSMELIEKSFGLPVCASVPFSKLLSDSNKTSFKNIYDNSGIQDMSIEALRSFRTYLTFKILKDSNSVIVIAGGQSGVGKSFVSLHTSRLLAQGGKKVLLIDADIRKGALHRQIGVAQSPGISNLGSSISSLREAVVSISDDFYFLPCGDYVNNPDVLTSAKFHDEMASLESEYNTILIDTSPLLMVTDSVLISKFATAVFVVFGLGKESIDTMNNAISVLNNNSISIDGIVCNYTNSDAYSYSSNYYSGYGSTYGSISS